jgi:hypothetical protein
MTSVLPSFTLYLLVYTVVVNLIFLLRPAPYGKFSIEWNGWWETLSISNENFKPLVTFGFYTFFIGWFDDDWGYFSSWPTATRGWVLLVWLNLYFVWRTFLSHLTIISIIETSEVEGKKRVPIWLPIVYLLFFGPAGLYLRGMTTRATHEIVSYEYILIVVSALALGMNMYVDVFTNRERIKENKGKKYQYIGKYLCEREIFQSLSSTFVFYDYMMLPPNYAFEVIHWFFFMFIAWSWEGVWFSACVTAFLIVRGSGQKKWYRMKAEAGECGQTSGSVAANSDRYDPLINKITF